MSYGVWTSPDGINWTVRDIPYAFTYVEWADFLNNGAGPYRYFIVTNNAGGQAGGFGGDLAMTSADGLSWIFATFPLNQTPNNIAVPVPGTNITTASGFGVAVSDGTVGTYTANDAAHIFLAQQSPVVPSPVLGPITAIGWGIGVFVLSQIDSSGGGHPRFHYNADPSAIFTFVVEPAFADTVFDFATDGFDLIAPTSTTGGVYYHTNTPTTAWTRATITGAGVSTGVAVGGGTWMLINAGNALTSAAIGGPWTSNPITGAVSPGPCAYGAAITTFVVGGHGSSTVSPFFYSTNSGATWTASNYLDQNTPIITDIAWSPTLGLFCAVGQTSVPQWIVGKTLSSSSYPTGAWI